jgi:2-phosphoglycerate kinase
MISKVFVIGGSPMSGKTTLARELASMHKYSCISTDDIGESLRAVIKDNAFNPMHNRTYIDYYQNNSIDQLINDTIIQHEKYWPSILAVIKAHLNWSCPMIIEGWGLYPKNINTIKSDNISSIWLIGNSTFFRMRLDNDIDFYKDSSNQDLFKSNFLERTVWHNNKIKEEAIEANMEIVELRNDTTITELVKQCEG